ELKNASLAEAFFLLRSSKGRWFYQRLIMLAACSVASVVLVASLRALS
ncbi:hypothetical protein PSYPI_46309, partial [Pseudomonas syringae pv. pisi str. 1704B]